MGITYSSVVPAGLAETFAWHARPGALTRLLPPWQPLRVRAEASDLATGRAVLGLPGGLTWVAQHGGFEPPHRFVDELTSLPLPWRHTHEFAAEGADRTRVTDRVATPVPEPLLRQTFRYRHAQLAEDLAVHQAMATLRADPLTVAVTGSSGLVGTALGALLSTGGHRVIRLVRRTPAAADERRWVPDDPDPDLLAGVDAVVHLAGASIAGRFTTAHRRAIRDSRIEPTRQLARLMGASPGAPRVLVCASAVGVYGPDRGEQQLDERSDRGGGFLADVVADWEAAAAAATAAGARVVTLRTGIVQSPRGGSLQLLRPLFAAGLGGRLGSGRQWTPWIDLEDVVDIYYRALVDERLTGAVNAVAPHPVRNAEYTATLARVLHRPAVVPVPGFGPRILLGRQGAAEVAAANQRVVPARLQQLGHRFRRPQLTDCLRHQLGHRTA